MTVLEGTIKVMITVIHTEKLIGKVWTGSEEWQVDQRRFFYLYNSINAKVIQHLKGIGMKANVKQKINKIPKYSLTSYSLLSYCLVTFKYYLKYKTKPWISHVLNDIGCSAWAPKGLNSRKQNAGVVQKQNLLHCCRFAEAGPRVCVEGCRGLILGTHFSILNFESLILMPKFKINSSTLPSEVFWDQTWKTELCSEMASKLNWATFQPWFRYLLH